MACFNNILKGPVIIRDTTSYSNNNWITLVAAASSDLAINKFSTFEKPQKIINFFNFL